MAWKTSDIEKRSKSINGTLWADFQEKIWYPEEDYKKILNTNETIINDMGKLIKFLGEKHYDTFKEYAKQLAKNSNVKIHIGED
jgi:hypothetical protein